MNRCGSERGRLVICVLADIAFVKKIGIKLPAKAIVNGLNRVLSDVLIQIGVLHGLLRDDSEAFY